MPVEANTVEFSYLGDGATTEFPFPARFLSEADIVVGVNNAQITSGFYVTGGGDSLGGSVVFLSPPAVGALIVLLRRPPASQLVDFVNGQTVLESTLDTGLDKLTMLVQYLLRQITRTVRVAEFGLTAVAEIVSSAADRAGRALVFDSDGVSVVPGPSATEIANAEAYAEAAQAALLSMGNSELVDTAYADTAIGGDWGPVLRALIAASASTSKPGRVTGRRSVSGALETASGMHLVGGTLAQTSPSVTGAFVTNVTLDSGAREQQDLTIEDVNVDGSEYPQPVYFVLPSGSTTTQVVLPAEASSVDGAYTGLVMQKLSGSNAGQYRTVSAYDGGTKTATLSVALPTAPVAGDNVAIGFNDNAFGFAWGATHVNLRGLTAEAYPMNSQVPFGAGGKGVNFEQGVTDAVMTGASFTDMFTAVFIQGRAGTLATGVSAAVTGVRVSNMAAENCGSVITIANLDFAAGISANGGELEAVVENITWHNCGHAPHRVVNTLQMKSGIINLLGANGATVRGGRGWNDAAYPATTPGYPTDYPARCGYGLSGPVGALIWGHARNTLLADLVHIGDLDAVVHIGRNRALGDDGQPNGYVSGCFAWDVDGAFVHGAVTYVVNTDPVYTLSGSNEISGRWRLGVNSASSGLVHPNLANVTQLELDITELQTGKRVIGTPKDIIAAGNTFASFGSGTTYLSEKHGRLVGSSYTIADDGAVSFVPASTAGVLVIASATSLLRAVVGFRADAAPQCTLLGPAISNFAVTTGALTGTTGVDTNFTVSTHTDGKVYLENRRGASATVTITQIG